MPLKTPQSSTSGSPEQGDVSVVLVGKPGVGKSALLNAVRGMMEGDVGAAPVGAPAKSGCPVMYPDLTHPNLLIWELEMESEGQAERWLGEADVFVVVTDGKFDEAHARLAGEVRAAGKKVYFARTKADLEVHTLKRLMRESYKRSEVLEALRGVCAESLGAPSLGEPFVFLVSAFEPYALDCPQLRETLLKDVQVYERVLKPARLGFELITEKEIAEIQEAYELGGLSEVVTRIQCSLETIWNAQLDIAVTGESGAGKSTFVNALRGLNDEDEGAAETGVTETTARPTPYAYPSYPNVILWDLPGIGTPNFQADRYLEAVEFSRYDFFIILGSERFRENHIHLAQAIVGAGKRFYFVRTKVDNDLDSIVRRKNPPTEEEVLEEIRSDCREKLAKAGLADAKVFLLSSFEINKLDFHAFEDTLEQELPSHKRHAFLLSLPNVSSAIIEKKRQLLHQEVWKVALISCLVAAVPLPGLAFTCDVSILLRKLSTYRQDFGLDAASLTRLAERSGKPLEVLRAEVRSTLGRTINKDVVVGLLGKATGTGLMVAEFLLHRIPLYGSLAAGSLSFHSTYSMLSHCLEELASDSQRVLLKAFDSEV
ncbi:interferon-inducible GTPase 5-like [Eublepharis macularius]|uniref:Interferon-inducible GTPase 5-like n=1 Tax=Eublepharis macularius TaxID=481883 RepID=A0AA97KIL1_EUBMA|nr:interferon-inducible GTPase 5-like [Eublepharis macularius]XP_054855879.1 interferon-inducible GTPase 5-like [Eublepharis macularius]XP_054855881.1 interferon-inducible GTPase 5-like [Eublepharis macularius]